MILRRLTEHVRAQNWFAVGLDFVIVVIGVFIGIQLGNWNAARENHSLERQYLTRLQAEVLLSIQENVDYLETWRARVGSLDDVAAYLKGEIEEGELGEHHCEAIVRSHLFSGEIAVPATINELLSTGRLSLISSEGVRTQIVQYSRAIDRFLLLNRDIQGHRVVLDSKYHGLIKRFPTGNMSGSECAYAAMLQSQAFINDFSDNYARFSAYYRVIMTGQQEQREALLDALNKEISTDSGNDAQ